VIIIASGLGFPYEVFIVLRAWSLLIAAILLEVVGTTSLKRTDGFTRPLPTLLMLICYVGAIYLLSLTVKLIPTSVAYAVWSGLGLVLVAVAGFWLNGEKLTWGLVLGIGMILAGVVILNLSTQVRH
jgi:small multidrug resistance pump